MRNHRFVSPFWHNFGCLLAYLFYIFWYQFWDAFLNATFPTFVPKWLPKWSDQKALRKLLGAPGRQRRPKGLSKTNNSPRAFLNRMPDGGLDAPSMAPGSSRASVLEHFHRISRTICERFPIIFIDFANGPWGAKAAQRFLNCYTREHHRLPVIALFFILPSTTPILSRPTRPHI